MGFLKKLFGGGKDEIIEEAAADAECPHTSLVPHWDSVDDMGKHDKITYYICEGCDSRFSREEGEKLNERIDPRLQALDPDKT